MCSATDRSCLDSFLNRCKRLGFCDKYLPSLSELFSDADDALFERINTTCNSHHVLQRYLPDRPSSLQFERTFTQVTKSSELSERDFLIRMLYKDCYWHFNSVFYLLLVHVGLRLTTSNKRTWTILFAASGLHRLTTHDDVVMSLILQWIFDVRRKTGYDNNYFTLIVNYTWNGRPTMLADLDWPLNASCGFVSISWVSCSILMWYD